MTARTLGRIRIAGISLFVIALAAAGVGGLFERPFRLSPYLMHLAPLVVFVAMFPQWLKTLQQSKEELGGRLPERRTGALTLALCGGAVALIVGFALAVYFGYMDASHGV